MIIGAQREKVIENIAAAAGSGNFHGKVEPNDPVLTQQEEQAIIQNYLSRRGKAGFQAKAWCARRAANIATRALNKDTDIVGLEKLAGVTGGAIITSNHFGPLDNTVVRCLTRKLGKKRLNIISQTTNFAMTGPIGYLMNYADTIPLSDDPQYLLKTLPQLLKALTDKGEWVLIYPEKEMWFNYRKPRPLLRGAYHFAAQLGVPVVSCFVEMRDRDEMDTAEFHQVRYRLHILQVLHPDPEKSIRENSKLLCARDYELKKAAYERIYGKPLTYDFDPADIAGWVGNAHE